MSRLYGDNEDISPEKVKDFFNDRANPDLENDLAIVLFQNKENSAQRHEEEKMQFIGMNKNTLISLPIQIVMIYLPKIFSMI